MESYLLDTNHAAALVTLGHPLRQHSAQPDVLACSLLDEADAENAATLQRSLRRQGWQLETVDALIVVVVLRYNLVLVTSDKDFAPVPNLKQENWLEGVSAGMAEVVLSAWRFSAFWGAEVPRFSPTWPDRSRIAHGEYPHVL
jgi:hypothetical protein